MKLDFYVIGAQKAGSTYLLRCLEEHPEIFMPPYEFFYFEDPMYADLTIHDFEKHFEGATEKHIVGAKRPNLLAHHECASRLREISPSLKLIVILRDPIERAISGYHHYMKTGFLPVVPMEIGIPRLLRGEYNSLPRSKDVLEFGLYGKHLNHYAKFFPRENFHVILFDDIKRDANEQLIRTYEFLGVKSDYNPSSQSSRPMAATYSIPRLRLWNLIDRFCRSYQWGGEAVERHRNFFTAGLYGLNSLVDRHVWARCFAAKRPKASHALQQQLAEYYREDIAQLEAWLGRRLPAWTNES